MLKCYHKSEVGALAITVRVLLRSPGGRIHRPGLGGRVLGLGGWVVWVWIMGSWVVGLRGWVVWPVTVVSGSSGAV